MTTLITTNLDEQEFVIFKEKYPEIKSHDDASLYFAAFLGNKLPFETKRDELLKSENSSSQNDFYVYVCTFATKGKNLSFIEWLFKNFHKQLKENIMAHKMIYFNAAEMNRKDIIQSVSDNGFYEFRQFSKCIYHAAKKGHLELIKWLMENGCKWDESACSIAAKNGYLEIIQWAISNNLAWNPNICFRDAAIEGHLEILKWAKTNEYFLESYIFDFAATSGQLEILKWFWENDELDCQSYLNKHLFSEVAKQGHLEVLEWLCEKKCPWDLHVCSNAAIHGHLHVIQWARKNGCDWDSETPKYAA